MTDASREPTALPDPAAHTVDVPTATAPAVRPPRWSGRKTAIVAALAISFASAGTIGAAAAVPTGTGADAGAHHGRMGTPPGMPGTPPGAPGGDRQGAPTGSTGTSAGV